MIIVNCAFSRTVRRPHQRRRVEWRNVGSVVLPMKWDDGHVEIRKALADHAPEGDGWRLAGYALVSENVQGASCNETNFKGYRS